MNYEKSCGAIVFRKFHGNIELLLIKHANGGHWSFPKGHVEAGETEVETAIREIREETGIEVMIDPTDVYKRQEYFFFGYLSCPSSTKRRAE